MYSLPSTSQMREPCARLMKTGVPPTDLNARTGELTPAGMTCCESSNSVWFLDVMACRLVLSGCEQGEGWSERTRSHARIRSVEQRRDHCNRVGAGLDQNA